MFTDKHCEKANAGGRRAIFRKAWFLAVASIIILSGWPVLAQQGGQQQGGQQTTNLPVVGNTCYLAGQTGLGQNLPSDAQPTAILACLTDATGANLQWHYTLFAPACNGTNPATILQFDGTRFNCVTLVGVKATPVGGAIIGIPPGGFEGD